MYHLKKQKLCKSKRNTNDFWEQLPPEQERKRKKEADPSTVRKTLFSSTLAWGNLLVHNQSHRRIGLLSFIWFVFSMSLTTLADHSCAHCNIGHEITSLPEVLLITYSDKMLRTMNSEIDIIFTYYSSILTNIQLFQKYHAIHHKRYSESCCIGPLWIFISSKMHTFFKILIYLLL